MEFIEVTDFADVLLSGSPLLDVRAESEFEHASVPSAVNIPLLRDAERAEVGTTYKHHGQDAAIELGHQLVSGSIRDERIAQWIRFIDEKRPIALYCARGGLRSQISQSWIAESGRELPRLRGGYKSLRNFLLQELERICKTRSFLLIGGRTGTGKTQLLTSLAQTHPVLDLEECALHRGSTFGKVYGEQPTQSTFENRMVVALMAAARGSGQRPILIEAESRRIGRETIPEPMWQVMQDARVLVLEESLEFRAELLRRDYVDFLTERFQSEEDPFQTLERFLVEAIQKNSSRLGNIRTEELCNEIVAAVADQRVTHQTTGHLHWITRMLAEYYDPFYDRHGEQYADRVVARGNEQILREYLRQI